MTDHRAAFSKWWVSEWKGVPFPEKGSVYDYYVDPEACLMVPWDERVPKFSYAEARGAGRGASLFVPTVETTRLTYFLDSLLANRWGGGLRGDRPSGRSKRDGSGSHGLALAAVLARPCWVSESLKAPLHLSPKTPGTLSCLSATPAPARPR